MGLSWIDISQHLSKKVGTAVESLSQNNRNQRHAFVRPKR